MTPGCKEDPADLAGRCSPRVTQHGAPPGKQHPNRPTQTGVGTRAGGRGRPSGPPGSASAPTPSPAAAALPVSGTTPGWAPRLPAGALARGPSSPTVGVDTAQQVLPQAHGVERGGHVHLLTGLEFHFGHVFLFEQPLPRRARRRHCSCSRHDSEQAKSQARVSEESGSRAPRRRCQELTS